MIDWQGILDRIKAGRLVLTQPEPVRKFEDWADDQSWEKILGWADRQVPEWTRLFFLHLLNVRAFADEEAIATRLAAGDLKGVEDLIGAGEAHAQKEGWPGIADLAINTAGGGARLAGAVFGLKFDKLNPKAIDFLSRYSYDLIRGLNPKQRDGIRDVIRNAFEKGGHPRQQAKEIIQHIGLLPRQRAALQNFGDRLMKETMKKAGVANFWELPMDVQQRYFAQRNRYGERLLKQRAMTIARTETIRASCMGQLEAWREAARKGLLDPANTVRVWITTKDDRTCEFCRPLNGKEVAFDAGEWTSTVKRSDGTEVGYTALTPPLHPNCRCAMGLKIGKAPLRVQVETQGKPGSGARKPKQAPADPWADKVKKLIGKGIQSEKDAIRIGKLIAEEIDRLESEALGEKLKPLEEAYTAGSERLTETLQNYYGCFGSDGMRLPTVHPDTPKLFWEEADKLRARLNSIRKMIDARKREYTGQEKPDRDIRRQVLARIREMGPPPGQEYHPVNVAPNTHKDAQEWLKEALQYMPRAWVEESYRIGPMILQSDPRRGFHVERHNGPDTLCIDEPRKSRTALHEMMHRMERAFGTNPGGIKHLEWEFYERRTKGYALKKLGAGYKDWEVFRKDKFLADYFGKDYRPARNIPDYLGNTTNWELLSMGIEYEFYGPNSWDLNVIMRNDPNLRAFVLGIMAGL